MTEFEIKDDIPIPIPYATYPFATMQLGQSFFVAGQTITGKAQNAARMYGRRHGKRFCARAVIEPQGVRIWRTE